MHARPNQVTIELEGETQVIDFEKPVKSVKVSSKKNLVQGLFLGILISSIPMLVINHDNKSEIKRLKHSNGVMYAKLYSEGWTWSTTQKGWKTVSELSANTQDPVK